MGIFFQKEFVLSAKKRDFHLITKEVEDQLPVLPEHGLLHLFIKHSSAGLCINENYDPDVRSDMKMILNELAPENHPNYLHNSEGPDDMPAHIKSVICGSSVTIPIRNSRLALGTWQGIYLGEFRNQARPRTLIVTITI